MILSFKHIAGRRINANNPREQDFIITQQQFQKKKNAEQIWKKQQGFMSY